MVPPMGIALACKLFPKKFTKAERGSAVSNFVMGCSFITEGAIPFAAADPLHVIPCTGWCRCSRSIISSIQMYTDGTTRRNLRICNGRTSIILHSFMGDRFCSNLFTARSDQEKCSRRIKTKTLSFLTTVGTERICSCRI